MAQRQRPDGIVLDLMMPVMGGYGVLDYALAQDDRSHEVSVLVLTAKALPEEQDRVTEAGAGRFMTKRFEPEDLTAALDGTLGR
jgi:CheY-like chemotaxis protein